jgi:hypothetical protein
MADKKLGIPRKLKTETHKQLQIRTDMNSDAPYEIERNYGAFNKDTLICFLRNILHLKKKYTIFFIFEI